MDILNAQLSCHKAQSGKFIYTNCSHSPAAEIDYCAANPCGEGEECITLDENTMRSDGQMYECVIVGLYILHRYGLKTYKDDIKRSQCYFNLNFFRIAQTPLCYPQ